MRYAVFYSFGYGPDLPKCLYYGVHKIEHMTHPNTILAYEMNGQPLPELHGAPLRLRNEVELGLKQVKWVQAVEFVETFADLGDAKVDSMKTMSSSTSAHRSNAMANSELATVDRPALLHGALATFPSLLRFGGNTPLRHCGHMSYYFIKLRRENRI